MITRRQCLVGVGGGAAAMLLPRVSEASAMRALSFEELVERSRHVLVATPMESQSSWEIVGRFRRIVTFTWCQVEDSLGSHAPGESEILVRTLGGRVDSVAQVVSGEAELALGRTCSVFLRTLPHAPDWVVTAMAQGHFPLRPDARGVFRHQPSPHLPELRHPERSAARWVDGKTVDDVRGLVTRALEKQR